MLTRLRTNLLDLKHHAGFAKFTRRIMKTRYSKCGFALSIQSDVRTKPLRLSRFACMQWTPWNTKKLYFLGALMLSRKKIAFSTWSVLKSVFRGA